MREAHPTKTFVSFVIFVVKNPFLRGALCVPFDMAQDMLCARYSEFRLRRSRARSSVINDKIYRPRLKSKSPRPRRQGDTERDFEHNIKCQGKAGADAKGEHYRTAI